MIQPRHFRFFYAYRSADDYRHWHVFDCHMSLGQAIATFNSRSDARVFTNLKNNRHAASGASRLK